MAKRIVQMLVTCAVGTDQSREEIRTEVQDALRGRYLDDLTVELVVQDAGKGAVCMCGVERRYHREDGTIQSNPWSDETCEGFVPALREDAR